ncbi:DUF4190 domain-containing protein [Streptomyces sp. NPDC050504]|uniref:DUF4190 domain-containing protein n=1 Tax=Streptomyces sp. NPDC050504 TaxID=3365618 RepID=UPI00378DEA6E
MPQPPTPSEPDPWAPPQGEPRKQPIDLVKSTPSPEPDREPDPSESAPDPSGIAPDPSGADQGYGQGAGQGAAQGYPPYPYGAAPHSPYGHPPYGHSPYGHPPMPYPAQAPRNGMGVTALVLGITGSVLGILVIFFWLSWIPALLAVVFGFIGLSQAKKGLATNRGMALAGTILGGVGLLFSGAGGTLLVAGHYWGDGEGSIIEVSGGDDSSDDPSDDSDAPSDEPTDKEPTEAEKRLAELEASRAAEAREEAEAAKPKAWGTTYTYPNGVSIKVGKPEPYTASGTAAGHTDGYKTYTVKITMTNGSKEKFDSLYAIPRFMDADDAEVQNVFDGDVPVSFRGALHPGKSKTGTFAFDLPPEAAGTAKAEMSPGVGYAEAIWSGPTGQPPQ